MSDEFVRGIRADEVAPGGMKAIELNGREIVVCNVDGTYYAIDRRCGHMSAPLEKGTLDGTIVTCAFHSAQFDVATGEVLGPPVMPYVDEVPPPRIAALLQTSGALMQHIRTGPIGTYEVKVDSEWVLVALERRKDR